MINLISVGYWKGKIYQASGKFDFVGMDPHSAIRIMKEAKSTQEEMIKQEFERDMNKTELLVIETLRVNGYHKEAREREMMLMQSQQSAMAQLGQMRREDLERQLQYEKMQIDHAYKYQQKIEQDLASLYGVASPYSGLHSVLGSGNWL